MKIELMIIFLMCLVAPLLASDQPSIPKEMKDYHYSSDTNVTVEVGKAIQAAQEILKKEGYKNRDGTNGQGVIYQVTKKKSDYWVMCQSYGITKDKKLGFPVGGHVVVVIDKEFKFKEMIPGA